MANIEKLVGSESRLELGQKINEIIDTKVSKTGDTITGNLTVEKDSWPIIYIKNSGQDRSVASSTDSGTQYLYFTDKNDATLGSVGIERYTNGRNTIKLQAFSADGTQAPAIRINAFADGTMEALAPVTPAATDSSTRIATTAFVKSVMTTSGAGLATFKKAANGYIKFANGIIIQWGRTASFSGELTVTLPTPFTSTNYSVVPGMYIKGDWTANWGTYSYTTTNFILQNQSSGSKTMNWLAIGY